MKRLFSIALAAILVGICACQRQEKDPSKPAVIDNPQAKEKGPPKPPVIDNPQAKENDPPKIIAIDPTKPAITNSIGMKFVWIPPGTFMMGSPKEEKGRLALETQHEVTLTKGFYMSIYTVTQEEWQAVMNNNPSYFKGEKNLPVENVSWEDCQEYIMNLREKDKNSYRLPTEAEWEYCCRARTTTPFHFGETISTEQANYIGGGNGKPTPVGSFPANAFGLFDMHGNVFQWCQDWFDDYPQNAVTDPQGPEKGFGRVLRGGSWRSLPQLCRSAHRHSYGPGSRLNNLGFRLCFFVE
jgi:formylglycine-generating enzyme required for sulfatase activity